MRPTIWAINRAREIKVYLPNMPGCPCSGYTQVCDTHAQIAFALDQAYFEGKTGVQHDSA